MSEFDLQKWVKANIKNLPDSVSEKVLNPRIGTSPPKTLEGIGIRPESALGEGDFKNYMYWRNRFKP